MRSKDVRKSNGQTVVEEFDIPCLSCTTKQHNQCLDFIRLIDWALPFFLNDGMCG